MPVNTHGCTFCPDSRITLQTFPSPRASRDPVHQEQHTNSGYGAQMRDTHGYSAEVEETLKRIQAHKGVVGTIVVNAEGIPIRTTLDNSTTVQYAGLLHQLTMKARSTVRDIDPQNDLTFLRIRSKKHEIMVAPDKEYLLIVIQNPCE
ncbi:dynein light chain roadblock-type 2 [Eudromia elegans]